jgi:hypothetical protein
MKKASRGILSCASCGCLLTFVALEAKDRAYWSGRRCDDCGEDPSQTIAIDSADLLWSVVEKASSLSRIIFLVRVAGCHYMVGS